MASPTTSTTPRPVVRARIVLVCLLAAVAVLSVYGPPGRATADSRDPHPSPTITLAGKPLRPLALGAPTPDGRIQLRVTASGADVSGDVQAFDADRILPGFRRVVVLAIGNERDDDVAVALRTTGLHDSADTSGRAELSGALRMATHGDQAAGGYSWSGSVADAQHGSGPVAVVRAHSTARVRLSLELPWDTGNDLQSTAVRFDLGLTASAAPGTLAAVPGGTGETDVHLATVAAGTGARGDRGAVPCWTVLALALLAPVACLLVPWSLRRRRIGR